jgi:phosphoribosylamine--glycine ligase
MTREGHEVTVAPGNAGIPNSTLEAPTFENLLELNAGLYVIGPEQPLVDGLADELRACGLLVFGPNKSDAQLEGSKAWMKSVLNKAGISTAPWVEVTSPDEAEAMIHHIWFDLGIHELVIKTSYLYAGKGVTVSDNLDILIADARAKCERGSVVIEHVVGDASSREASQFSIFSGGTLPAALLTGAQDFKHKEDGNLGPMTGGMGAFSPIEAHPNGISVEEQQAIFDATTKRLLPFIPNYRGVLFAGLMLCDEGPKILEYNSRFGDPESQVMFARCTSGLTNALYDAARGLTIRPPIFSDQVAVGIVMAAEGYAEPGRSPRTGDIITGIEDARALDDVVVYCSGVATNDAGDLVTNGGRVLTVVGLGPDIESARARAYAGVDAISFDGAHFRTDIAA